MTLKNYLDKLNFALKTMTEDRDRLNGWEQGYTDAINESIKHVSKMTGEEHLEKRRWAATCSVFAQLMRDADSPEEIEGAVQTAIYAAERLVTEYKTKNNNDNELEEP